MSELVTITPAAIEQLRVALAAADDPELGLRAAARRTPDGEVEFGMGLDEPRDQDEQIEVDAGIKLLVSVASRELIAGTQIDYVEIEPGEFRFVFVPAQTQGGCTTTASGCGNCSCGSAQRGPGEA